MIRRRIGSLVVCAAMLFSTVFPTITARAEGDTLPQATGNTYYVSTLDGNDRNSGKSETEALYSLTALSQIDLQPGDRVLLERGSNFYNDFLHLHGVKGTQDAPIVIDAYGDSGKALPVINTNGQGIWYQDYGTALDNAQHVYRGYVSSSILLYDCEYIEISNIAMTNRNLDIDVEYNARSMMNRTGVAVVAQNGGTLDHIYLKGLDIQDVQGNVQDKHMNNGGIYFTVFKPENEGSTGIARYNDVRIEDCYLKSVNRWGIALAYTAYHAKFPDSTISNEAAQTYGMTNVFIRNNYLEDVGGDAITTMYCYRPVVEYNVANGAASQINAQDYKGEGTTGDKPFGCVAASVWPWKCKDAVFQYNEVYNTHNDGGWNGDGQAWDADWGDGTVYQYNYSHDNEGGCFMICLQHAYNSVFRYNISQNDSTGIIVAATNPNANIYNNTFYIKEGVPFVYTNSGSYGTLDVKNNIIYYAGSTPKNEDWRTGSCTYENNIFVNYNNVPTGADNIQLNAEQGASLMVDPGKGGTGNAQGNALNTLNGYKLQEKSPAINAGTMVETPAFLFEMESQGVHAGQDFFGNSILGVVPDVGAHQYSKLTGLGSTKYQIQDFTISNVNGDTAETVLNNLIAPEGWSLTLTDAAGQTLTGSTKVPGGSKVIVEKGDGSREVYTVAMNTQVDILYTPFERQSNSIHVPDLTKVNHLLDALELSWGASAKVMSGGVEQDRDVELTSGMILQIISEDAATQNTLSIQVGPYSILESIETEDGQQGEIWYAQQRISAEETNEAYADLTSWHSDWKGWSGFSDNQWAFVGADSGSNTTNIKIVDETDSRNGFGHALGFRAPLDGVISITGLEAIVNSETGNTGTIWASLTKNGAPLVDQQQISGGSGPVNFDQENIQVKAGDIIRFEVQNKGGAVPKANVMAPMVVTYTSISTETAPVITTTALKDGKENEAYSDTLQADSNTAVRWSITAGSLPAGLTLDETSGVISGTPTAAGTATFTVTATNNAGSSEKEFTITVVAQTAKYYTVTFESNGGTPVAQQTVEENGFAAQPPAPSRSGYIFTGWYLNAACTQKFDFAAAITKDLTLYAGWRETGSSSGGGSSGGGNKTEITHNPDGSTTTTVTKPDGTVTETTVSSDGGKTVVETKPDGNMTTTITRPDGSSSVTKVDETGKWESEIKVPENVVDAAEEKEEKVTLPLPGVPNTSDLDSAPTVTVQLPKGKSVLVEIPVDDVTSGTVAVLVKEDGTEEVIKTTVATENGVAVTLTDDQSVKIVDNSKDFSDVPNGYWGVEAIDFASSRELFGGTSPNTFSTEVVMTRGMMVTVLASLEGVDTSTGSVWYEAGQKWAMEEGISDGTNMDQGMTREQLALMLYRYAGSPAVSGDVDAFADKDSISSWATQAMVWAVQEGLISGVGDNTLNPQGQATRAQVATILMRFIENSVK